MKILSSLTALALILATPLVASATPFVITSELTGDGRAANPDFLNVDVTITGNTDSAFTSWVVDLDMAATHPSASLHEFYINLLGDSDDYAFSSPTPASWIVSDADGGTNANGSGNWDYMLEISGPNNTVTNSINLTFTLQKVGGNFTIADFTSTPTECSNDAALGCGRLGAHIGSLNAGQGQSDSGFALGNYTLQPPRDVQAVPEPMSLTLLGSGLVALAARARRRNQAPKA